MKIRRKLRIRGLLILTGIGTVIALIIGVIIFGLMMLINSPEKKLHRLLTKMTSEYYTEFYYPSFGTDVAAKEFLASNESGLTFNLNAILGYKDDNADKFYNKDQKCDVVKTRAVLYPKEPYGKKDYTIKTFIDCGF